MPEPGVPFEGPAAEDRVDLWLVDVPGLAFAEVLPEIESSLSRDEVEAAMRFVSDRHRTLYGIAHAALRVLIGRYLGRAPQTLEFERGRHGRPELRDRALRFNLSHTDGIAAIAITSRLDVGVDVERTNRRGRFDRIVGMVMTEEERARFRGTADEFFEVWTLKEAYAKARGGGLTLGFRNFGFRLGADPVLVCGSDFDDGSRWRFTSFAPRAATRVSAAVGSSGAVSWSVRDVAAGDLLDLR